MNSPQLPRKGKPLGYGFSILQILLSADKRCPQGLKPGTFEIYGTAEPVPFQETPFSRRS